MAEKKIDPNKDDKVQTTGHIWDGIEEFDNRTPKWLNALFWICIFVAVGLAIYLPSFPTLEKAWHGMKENNDRRSISIDMKEIKKNSDKYLTQIDTLTAEQISTNPELLKFAQKIGDVLFKQNCVACHGDRGKGGNNYPTLADDDWLWGGTISEIEQTIRYGVRSINALDDTHDSQMTQFTSDVISATDLPKLIQYVLSLSGSATNQQLAAQGSQIFADNCTVCHGVSGEGNQELGAPSLNDKIWLYSGTPEAIASQIRNPRMGVMPAWESSLSSSYIKILTVYVHSLGGGK